MRPVATYAVGRQNPWNPWPALVVRIEESFTGSPASAGDQYRFRRRTQTFAVSLVDERGRCGTIPFGILSLARRRHRRRSGLSCSSSGGPGGAGLSPSQRIRLQQLAARLVLGEGFRPEDAVRLAAELVARGNKR